MAWCPITKSDCDPDCVWFRRSRRRSQDHIIGACSLVDIGCIPDRLKEISDNISKLEQTIEGKDFTY